MKTIPLDELLRQITPLPYVVDDGLIRQQDMIDVLTADIPNHERHWAAIGIADEDGFAESVAYCHPSNQAYLAHAANVVPELVAALNNCTRSLRVAFQAREDAFGIHHNDATDALLSAEAALAKATQVPVP